MERSLQSSEAHIDRQPLRFSSSKVWRTLGGFQDMWQIVTEGGWSKLAKNSVTYVMDGPTSWQGTNCRLLPLAGEDGVDAQRSSFWCYHHISTSAPLCSRRTGFMRGASISRCSLSAGSLRLMECRVGAKANGGTAISSPAPLQGRP